MRRKISQREARAAIKALRDLQRAIEAQRNRWASDYPGGTVLMSFDSLSDWSRGVLETATRLAFPLVTKYDEVRKKLYVYAVKP